MAIKPSETIIDAMNSFPYYFTLLLVLFLTAVRVCTCVSVCVSVRVHACVKVEASKKSYHQTRKEEWTAMNRETHAKADPTKSQEEVRKFTSRVERCNQEAEKVQNSRTLTHEHTHSLPGAALHSGCVSESRKKTIPVCVFLTFGDVTGLVSSAPHKLLLLPLRRTDPRRTGRPLD